MSELSDVIDLPVPSVDDIDSHLYCRTRPLLIALVLILFLERNLRTPEGPDFCLVKGIFP